MPPPRFVRVPLIAACLSALLCLAPIALAEENARGAPFPYTKQGPFVVIPASIVSSPAYQAGYIAGVFLCLPVSIARDARNEGRVPHDKQASILCGRTLGAALGWPVYAAAGLPFFLLKTAFWDAPRALLPRRTQAPK